MASNTRLKGQDVQIVVTANGSPVTSISAIGSSSDSTEFEIKEDSFLGEVTDRFDSVLKGYSIDFEAQVTTASWISLESAINDKATRKAPANVFNIVRVDMYSDGSNIVYTYKDVSFGPIAKSTGSRTDFVKIKFQGKCSERPILQNSIL